MELISFFELGQGIINRDPIDGAKPPVKTMFASIIEIYKNNEANLLSARLNSTNF
jgi:hypothetical protein